MVRTVLVILALVAPAPALAGIEDCGSSEFHREFLAGAPMEPVEGPQCALTSPNPRLVKAGDRVLPCLVEMVEGAGTNFPECRKEPRLCRNWAMRTIAATGTPRATAFLMSVAGSTADADLLIGAVGSLANMEARQAIPILRARLDSGEDRVRAEVVMSLGILQARDLTPELVKTTLRLKPEEFYRAIHGFRFLGDPTVVPPLRAYVDAMPPSDLRNLLIKSVNDIAVLANFDAGVEQMKSGNMPWAESFVRVAVAEGERTGAAPATFAEALFDLGDMCRRDGRLEDAERFLGRAADAMRSSLPSGDGKYLDLEIARALAREARGTDPGLADRFAYIARLLRAALPERRSEIEARFPELPQALERIAVYCRANNLAGCRQDLNDFLPERLRGASDVPGLSELGSLVTASTAVPTSACAGLDAQGRDAMQWFIKGAFPIPSPWIECREDNGVNAGVLQRQKPASVPCLLQIYRFGLANTGLWSRAEPPPADGGWAIVVLGQVDRPSAIVLWREKASTAADPWARLGALFQVGRLGDPSVLPDLASGLADPPSAAGWKPNERDGFLADVADLLAQYDYRPALSALKRLNDTSRPSFRWLDLHILQLQGDVATLEGRARDRDAAGHNAVRALYRMRAREALTRISADPRHPQSALARHYLSLNMRL